MKDSLQITVQTEKERVVIYLQGKVSIETSPDFRDRLLAILRGPSPPETFAIDMAAVSYMDTSGLATLVQALKVARMAGIGMHLQGLQGQILHLFQTTGIASLFEVFGSAANTSTTKVS